MKNKRGSHVGIILSFVVFVAFGIFLYSIIQPVAKVEKEKQFLLNYLESALKEKFSAGMTMISVNVNASLAGNDCVYMNKKDIRDNMQGKNSTIKDESENILNHSECQGGECEGSGGGGGPIKLKIDLVNSSNKLFNIYASTELPNSSSSVGAGCLDITDNITIGIVRKRDYIFESKILRTIEEYKNGSYESLKNELKFPAESDFGFSFINSNFEVSSTEENVSQSLSIYSKEIPIQYMNNESTLLPGFINIRVW